MTNVEFAEIIGYISMATGATLKTEAQVVYFDLLGDLPADVLKLAAKRVLLEHRYPTFPSACELRQAAADTERGEVTGLSGPEAFALAWRAVGRMDLEVDGSKERALKALPPAVAEALNAMGLANVIYGQEPVAVIRAQFLKTFEAISAREKRAALLPAATRQAIEQRAAVLPMVRAIADGAGV